MFSNETIKAEKKFFSGLFVKITIVILFVCLCVHLRKKAVIRQARYYQEIFTSQINQKISRIHVSAGFVHMRLVNGEKFATKLDGPKDKSKGLHLKFSNLAEVGDSVAKEANSKIVILFHDNKKLVYEIYE